MSSQIEIEDVVCPRCKTTRYRNPSLKLMVNTCGHSLLVELIISINLMINLPIC